MVLSAGDKLGLTKIIRPNGTYCCVSGPSYESRCEARFLRSIGGDSVGMSTVPEVIAAKHCGMKVLGLSIITNKVLMSIEETAHASHEEVLEAIEKSANFVESIVKEITKKDILGAYLDKLPPCTYKPKGKSAVVVEEPKSDICNGVFTVLAISSIVFGIAYVAKNKFK